VPHALPTLVDAPNPPKRITPKRPAPKRRLESESPSAKKQKSKGLSCKRSISVKLC